MTVNGNNIFISNLKKLGLLPKPVATDRKKTVLKEILSTGMILFYPAAVTVITKNSLLCPVSLFVTMYLFMSDPGGIYIVRLRTMFAGALILSAGIIIAGYSVNIPVLVIILVFTWSFIAGMLNVSGIRGKRLSSIAAVSFIIFILSPHKLPGMFTGVSIIAGCFIWISAVRLWRWPFEPDSPLLAGIAGYFRLMSPVKFKITTGINSGNDGLFRLDIQSAERAGRLALLMIRDLKGSGNPSAARMYRIIKRGEIIFSLLQQMNSFYSKIPDRDLYSASLNRLVAAVCVLHEELALMMENFLSSYNCKGIDTAMYEFAETLQLLRNIISGNIMQDKNQWKDFLDSAEKYSEQVRGILKIILVKDSELPIEGGTGVKKAGSVWATLKNSMAPDSEIFRHSLRSGIVLAFATALEILLKIPHGYWLTLSAAIILKPGREESWTRARERIAGTFTGCLLAFFITLVFRLKLLILFISLISVMIAFRNRPGNYFIYAVFWTLAIILIIDINNLDNRIIALERIVYTLSGGILAIGSVHFIFPVKAESENG